MKYKNLLWLLFIASLVNAQNVNDCTYQETILGSQVKDIVHKYDGTYYETCIDCYCNYTVYLENGELLGYGDMYHIDSGVYAFDVNQEDYGQGITYTAYISCYDDTLSDLGRGCIDFYIGESKRQVATVAEEDNGDSGLWEWIEWGFGGNSFVSNLKEDVNNQLSSLSWAADNFALSGFRFIALIGRFTDLMIRAGYAFYVLAGDFLLLITAEDINQYFHDELYPKYYYFIFAIISANFLVISIVELYIITLSLANNSKDFFTFSSNVFRHHATLISFIFLGIQGFINFLTSGIKTLIEIIRLFIPSK